MDLQLLLSRLSKLRRKRGRLIESAGVQTCLDFGGAWGLLDPASTGWFPSQNVNRVIDLGCDGSVRLDHLHTPFEDAGVPRFFAYLDPYPVLSEVSSGLSGAGYRLCNEVSVLVRSLDVEPEHTSNLTVKQVSEADRADIEQVITYHGIQVPMWEDKVTGVLGKPGIEVFLAYNQDVPISVGVLNYDDGLAYLSNATTVPEHRGLGAQRALIAARLRVARDLGCDLAYVETYRFLEISFNNLLRAGFKEVYSRLIYRYEFDPELRKSLLDTVYGHQPPAV